MPELPEVEITARGLRGRVVGKRIADVGSMDWPRMLPNAQPEALRRGVVGRVVAGIDRRGKFLLLGLDDGTVLAIHRKMSGNLLLRPAGTPRESHTHLHLRFDDGEELRFVDPRKFGRVYLFASSGDLDAFVRTRLGPEPLTELTPASLARMVEGRRGRIKPLLLNQAFLAGLGNLYADEALWEAGIHPERAADSLTRSEVARLAEAIRAVLLRAIARRGTSISSYRDAEGVAGENQDFLNVYGRGPRAGHGAQPCPRCRTPIERIVIGQRSSYYCPRCQRRRRRQRQSVQTAA